MFITPAIKENNAFYTTVIVDDTAKNWVILIPYQKMRLSVNIAYVPRTLLLLEHILPRLDVSVSIEFHAVQTQSRHAVQTQSRLSFTKKELTVSIQKAGELVVRSPGEFFFSERVPDSLVIAEDHY